ncbi:protein-tyrosine phosphatase-like protein [Chytriomyces sp. MP71]|nr:protein-tyrosine phosphatase-like protein [Chytriomyces sp. MP71]
MTSVAPSHHLHGHASQSAAQGRGQVLSAPGSSQGHRTSQSHPINVSWLFPHAVLVPSCEREPPVAQHPDGITPLDCLDFLGIPRAQYPTGRAPSSSGFIGGFPVAKTVSSATIPNALSIPQFDSRNNAISKTSISSAQSSPRSHLQSSLRAQSSSTRTQTSAASLPASDSPFKANKAPPTTSTSTISATTANMALKSSLSMQSLQHHHANSNANTYAQSIHTQPLLEKLASVTPPSLCKVPLDMIPPPAHSPNSTRCPAFEETKLRIESTHGREAIEMLEASGAEVIPEEADAVLAQEAQDVQLQETLPAFITLPNGVTVKGDGESGVYGNVALSSCPGKKVRLDTGPVNGRASINRDLDSDFARLASLNIKCVVCCLNDAELSYLGAPISKYLATAAKYDMQVIRIPIIEGSCPESISEVEGVIRLMDARLRTGVNVLVHCRGGVGRAGLIACCLLLSKGFVVNAERAIQFVRIRRSLKAIETMRQEDFISAFQRFLEGHEVPPSSHPDKCGDMAE